MTEASNQVVIARPDTVDRRRAMKLVAVAAFLYWAALYLYVPTLPLYVQTKTDDLQAVGLILSMYGLFHIVVRPLFGFGVTWAGRGRPFVVAGLGLVIAGALVLGTATTPLALLIGRAIVGAGASTWVPVVLIFSRLFPPEEGVRATALITLVSSISLMLASGATGFLNDWGGYPLAIYVAAGLGALAMLVFLFAPEIRLPPERPSVLSVGRVVIRKDVLLPSILAAVTMHADWTVTFGFLPVLSHQLGASNVTQGVLVAVYFALRIVGNSLTSVAARRFGTHRLLVSSILTLCTGMGIAALLRNLVTVYIVQACCGLAIGICYPLLMALSVQQVSDHDRPAALGIQQSVYAIGMFTGPAVSGRLIRILGIQGMFGVTCVVCLVLSMLLIQVLSKAERAKAIVPRAV
jgi:DHA1 family multidrug resistance protein-like MFS transporter